MNLILPDRGDRRFDYLAESARDAGWSVLRFSECRGSVAGAYLLPFGVSEGECLDLFKLIPAKSFVFLGKCGDGVKALAKKKDLHLVPLLENEYYLEKNAVHTAEGTLSEIIAKTDRSLDQLTFLVYGYGNCGKAIARLLWLCGSEVWVWSRERGQTLAAADGFNLYPAPKLGLGMFDGVINTVPEPIFTHEMLSTMRCGSFFFQIASGTSGIDPKKAEEMGFHFVPLHGLPGKYAPASEADAIRRVVEETIHDRSAL